MPKGRATEVLYDVAKAIGALKKLEQAIVKHGKKAKKHLEEPGKPLDLFAEGLRNIHPAVGKLSGGLIKLGVASSAAAVGFSAVGFAVVATLANVLDFAQAMRGADDTLGDFLANAKRAQAFADAGSQLEDSGRDQQFQAVREAVAAKRLFLTQGQIENDAQRDTATRSLRIESDRLRQIENLRKAARRKTLDAEKRLKEKLSEGAIVGSEFSGRPTGRQVGDLAVKARQEAAKGNVDAAEQLIEKAKELSAELGNHSFFTDQIKRANDEVVNALRKKVSEAKSESSELDAQAKGQETLVQNAQDRLAIEEKVSFRLRDQLKLLGAQNALLKSQKKAEGRLQDLDQAGRNIGSGKEALDKELKVRGLESGLRILTDAFKIGASRIYNFTTFDTGGSGAKRAGAAEGNLFNTLKQTAPGGFTPEEIKLLQQTAEKTTKEISAMRTEIKGGVLSPSVERYLARTDALLTAVSEIVSKTNSAAIGANVLPGESVASAQERLRGVADQAQQGAKALGAQITINSNIQGGSFDEDAIKQVLEIWRREARKEVAKQIGSK